MDVSPVAATAPLTGLQLIEASAGTGKTWTIAGLFLRLVVERGLPVDQVLAVTFTRAATAELRDRIRDRLHQLAAALPDAQALDRLRGEDPVVAALLTRIPADTAHRRCEAALRNFDAAPIYTIHGFCQRALADQALSAGIAFDTELTHDISDWLRTLVQDVWRQRITGAAPGSIAAEPRYLARLQAGTLGPERLQRWLASVLNKAGLTVLEPAEEELRTALATLDARFAELTRSWPAVRADLEAHMLARGWRSNTPGRLAAMDAWLDHGDPLATEDKLRFFLADKLLPAPSAGVAAGPIASDIAWISTFTGLHTDAQRIRAAFDAEWRRLRTGLLATAGPTLPARMAQQGVQGFDALLSNLHGALHGAQGPALAQALRARYPAALIDEFQDTDSLQWGILARIYADGGDACAFLVGDPKQAIYSFRGADVQAYLGAVARCSTRHALPENQRSVPGLVDALNRVYARRDNPFLDAGIVYPRVRAATRPKPPLLEHGRADEAPLRLLAPPIQGSKGDERAQVAAHTAAEIARLLADARIGQLRLGEAALRAGDIAVLVNTHSQGEQMAAALSRYGIPCARQSNESVFHSEDAEQLGAVLMAIAHPQRDGWLRAALATDLLGVDAASLLRLSEDESALQIWLDAFSGWQQVWREQGFMRMFQRWLREAGVIPRLAARGDGERRLTNLFHLAELAHAERSQHTTPGALIAWLAARRSDGRGENAELRLESDAALVQVVTIHRSKGLEYPVVFVPYLWDASAAKAGDDIVLYHDPAPPHALVLDASGNDLDHARALAQGERLAESLRLAYVALTRARNRCYLQTSAHPEMRHSALGWLLHGLHASTPLTDSKGKPLTGDARKDALLALVSSDLAELERNGGGHIRVQPVDTGHRPLIPSDTVLPALACAHLPRPLPAATHTTSFTALLRLIDGDAADADADHDQIASNDPAPALADDIAHRFPRGADAGVCLHALFETMDFAAPAIALRPLVAPTLAAHGFAAQPSDAVAGWLARCCAAPLLDSGLQLAHLPASAQRRELEFQLPLDALDPAMLTSTLRAHGWPVSPLAGQRIRGFLKGFIDLAFRNPQDGRWWVLDYKSNALGADNAAYTPDALAQAMADADYPLQAALYLLALHRWLSSRLPGYDPARDLGGGLYLFLRGLSPDAPGRGVHRLQLSAALLGALDGLVAAPRPMRLAGDPA